MICSICSLEAPVGIHSLQLKCGHRIHTKCWDKKGVKECKPDCQGIQADVFQEPTHYNGHDYVADPRAPSLMTKMRQMARGSNAMQLLSEHIGLKTLIRQHQFGLQRLLAEGFDMDDFCTNGYTWDELQEFRDIRERPKDTLFALGCTVEHFRDYAHLLPVGKMEITGREMVERFGFAFEENGGPPGVVGGKNNQEWTAKDLVDLGFKYADLIGADMQYLEQYAALKPDDDDEIALGVTDAYLDALFTRQTKVEPVAQPKVEPKVEPVAQVRQEPKKTTVVVTLPPVRRLHGLKTK